MILSGVAELFSLGSVIPFLSILTNPEQLWGHPTVRVIAGSLGYTDAYELVVPTALLFAGGLMTAAVIRLANLRLNGLVAAALGTDLSCDAYRRTLYQSYETHVKRNGAALITSATVHISATISAINCLLQLITSGIVAIGLFLGLMYINLQVALVTSALFGITYVLLAVLSKRALHKNGNKIAFASRQLMKALQEGLGAIRDVLLDGTQDEYLSVYRVAEAQQRKLRANNYFLAVSPRYVLEALGMITLALVGSVLVLRQGNESNVLPLMGAFALGAQRMLPALQQVYGSWASIKGYSVAVEDVLRLLEQPLPEIITKPEPLRLKRSISLSNICYQYDQNKPHVLKNISLEILSGERIGFIGSTGSGKSTAIDLIMGLLKPTSGKIYIDGIDLYDQEYPQLISAWRASIAHVPQSIFLSDNTIAENIAFGVPKHKIDIEKVRYAAQQAQILKSIEDTNDGFNTYVGERGIQLSGGQRQRIGIARALYRDTKILVFDEATSALDNATEKSVMNALDSLGKDLTILLIAHRLSTVERCDRLITLEKGRITSVGTPGDVLRNI